MSDSPATPTDEPTRCPWCKSDDPNKVGMQPSTGKVCRDPFHCPIPDSHSANGGPFRYCQYCDWREEPSNEPPAGTAINWAWSDPPSVRSDVRTMSERHNLGLTDEQIEQIAGYFEEPGCD